MDHYEEEFEPIDIPDSLVFFVIGAAFMLVIMMGLFFFGFIKLATVRDIGPYDFHKVPPAFMGKEMALTKKQREVMNFIRDYRADHKVSPTQLEIQKHFKFKSIGSVQDYLFYLEKYSLIKVDKKSARGIALVDQCPTCGGPR